MAAEIFVDEQLAHDVDFIANSDDLEEIFARFKFKRSEIEAVTYGLSPEEIEKLYLLCASHEKAGSGITLLGAPPDDSIVIDVYPFAEKVEKEVAFAHDDTVIQCVVDHRANRILAKACPEDDRAITDLEIQFDYRDWANVTKLQSRCAHIGNEGRLMKVPDKDGYAVFDMRPVQRAGASFLTVAVRNMKKDV